jgi:hypothetical protein
VIGPRLPTGGVLAYAAGVPIYSHDQPQARITTESEQPMAKEKFNREKPHCNVGTIGHVDHGKTRMLPIVEESAPSAYLCEMKVSPEEMAVRRERRTLQAEDGLNAMAEYQALAKNTRLKTERLKAERLAKLAEESAAPPVKKVRKSKRTSSSSDGALVEG